MGNKVERIQTNVTEPQMAQAMIEAWKSLFGIQPTKEQIGILMSQNALETGSRKSMYNFNIGNIKGNEKSPYDFYFLNAPEQMSPGIWKNMNMAFRAYPSLIDGVKDYIKLLSTSQRYAEAWKHVMSPDPASFSKALKKGGYYTADEAPYTKLLSRLYSKFNKSDSYDQAVAGKVGQPITETKDKSIVPKDSFLDKLNNLLTTYMGALASNYQVQKKYLDKNEFLIKVNSQYLFNSIEYSRILCETLEEELSSRTYMHSNGSDIEIECKIYGNPLLCKKAINTLCDETSEAFKHATGKLNGIKIEYKIFPNIKSQIDYLDDKLANTSYRKFRLHLLSRKD